MQHPAKGWPPCYNNNSVPHTLVASVCRVSRLSCHLFALSLFSIPPQKKKKVLDSYSFPILVKDCFPVIPWLIAQQQEAFRMLALGLWSCQVFQIMPCCCSGSTFILLPLPAADNFTFFPVAATVFRTYP